MTRRLKLRSRNRRGVAAVEFAVTAGLAFFFFFAALEFSRVAMMRHTVDNALYEGARAGIVPGATSEEVAAVSRRMLSTIGVNNATIDVTPAVFNVNTPDVNVRIRIELDRNLYGPAFFFRGLNLDRSYTMRREVPQ